MKDAHGFETEPTGSTEPRPAGELSSFTAEGIEALAEYAKSPDKIKAALKGSAFRW
ncbi:MAG: hypothetical protein QOD56_3154 [Gammaproteobacteria bacterium]|nr:hypothetical protein [Gammaproteobacteria bacterium]